MKQLGEFLNTNGTGPAVAPAPLPVETWEPSQDDFDKAYAVLGVPKWEDFRFDHLPADEAKTLQTAISAVKTYIVESKKKRGLSLILIASKVDNIRTGYGCGKTTLAQIVHGSFYRSVWAESIKNSLRVSKAGSFYEARKLMAKFDAPNFDLHNFLTSICDVLIIDDVGREGNLRYEKRDPEIQAQEKRDRYYSIINHCYTNRIPVVITSNLTSRELADHLGGATWSRLLNLAPKEYRVNMTGITDMRPLLAQSEDWF